MSNSGANIGNFAFRHALKTMINIGEYIPVTYSSFNRIAQDTKPESVVISCANWLCGSEQYERSNGNRADTIEKADCPVTVFGLGAQASKNDGSLSLGPNTIRLAKVISERAKLVSVRDEFTQSVLNQVGVKNTVVTGCPSNFINLDPQLGSKILAKASSLLKKGALWQDLRAHFSEYSGGHGASGRVLKSTFDLLKISPSFYVIQSPVLFPFILNESEVIPDAYLSNRPAGFESKESFTRFLRSKLLHFSSIDAWMDFCRTCDLAIGMRIHGNMLPLQAGVPSVVIGHDTRTSGLSNTMGVPVVSPEDFVGECRRNPQFVLNKVISTMTEYDQKRRHLAKTFVNYIETNGLVASSGLVQLAN
jgi:hypothetical protein